MGRSDFVSRSLVLADLPIDRAGRALYVSASDGDDGDSGLSWDKAKLTIQAAITAASALDTIVVEPGDYTENLTVLRAKPNLNIVGLGGYGDVAVQALTDGVALTAHADALTLRNIDLSGDGAGGAAIVTGKRFRAHASKFEGGTNVFTIGPGTLANKAAGLQGNGSDSLLEDCELAWATKGIILQGTDFGGTTQNRFRRCAFHNLSAASIAEAVGTGGSAAVTFFNLEVTDCVFDTAEDGTVPTKWVSLNANNANTGILSGCRFPTALNSGKNLVSTKLLWIGNYHTGGLSNAQPS